MANVLAALVLLAIAVVLLVASKRGCITNENLDRLSKVASIVALLAALVVLVHPVVSNGVDTLSEPPVISVLNPDSQSSVEITEPQDEQEVPRKVLVKGTFRDLPKGCEPWVVIHPSGTGLWFPQEEPIIRGETEGTWHVDSNIGLEEDVDKGRPFEIAVVIADRQAASELEKYVGRGGVKLDPVPRCSVRVTRK